MSPEQLQILQELSSRKDLSDDKKAIVSELLSRSSQKEAPMPIDYANKAISGLPQLLGGSAAVLATPIAKKIVPPAFEAIKSIPMSRQEGKRVAFAESVRKDFVKAHTNEVKRFGKSIDALAKKNPSAFVDISDLVSEIQSDPNMDSAAIRILRKTPKLDNILNNPQLSQEVPLKDVQDMINHLGKKTKNLDIQDAVNNLRARQLEAFPEMSKVREKYAKFIEPYKSIKSKFKTGNLLKALENKFGDSELNIAAKKVLPPATIEKINNFRRASNINLGKITSKLLGGAGKVMSVIPPNIVVPILQNDPESAIGRMVGVDIPLSGSPERVILEKVANKIPLTPEEKALTNDPRQPIYSLLGGI